MAVMQNMREYTKTILIILVLAFLGTIIFDWGMNVLGIRSATNVIGKVNGAEITVRQYEQAYANQRESFRTRTGNEPTESQTDFLRNQAWEALVQEHLIQQALEKNNIKASDEEIVYLLFNNPPDFLRKQEAFQNEQRQFDMAKYQAALNAPTAPGQWRYVEEILRLQVPQEKFLERLRASVRVTEDEVKREYLKNNQKVKVNYLFIELRRFSNEAIEITEEMVERYYEEHQEDYREDEKRKIDYVVFSTAATAEDSASQWDLARSLLERVTNGDDFAELAEIYSEDTGSKEKGGDLGYFGAGEMVRPFEEAAFKAKVGEIVGPVLTNIGLHIIKVEDKKTENGKEQVRARHILLKFEASSKTYNTARDDAIYFAEEAKNLSFEQVASDLGMEIKSTAPFLKGNGFVPVLGLNRGASNFIFSNDVGKVGEPEEFPQGFFVYKVSEIQTERIKPLSEVKETITNKLRQQERMTLARQFAQTLYEKIQGGLSFEEAAEKDSLEIKEVSFGRSGFVAGVGREPQFIGAAFALQEAERVSKPVEATRGYYILKLIEKDEFDVDAYDKQKDLLKQQLLQRKQSQAFANWYANVKENADIKDYRDRFF